MEKDLRPRSEVMPEVEDYTQNMLGLTVSETIDEVIMPAVTVLEDEGWTDEGIDGLFRNGPEVPEAAAFEVLFGDPLVKDTRFYIADVEDSISILAAAGQL